MDRRLIGVLTTVVLDGMGIGLTLPILPGLLRAVGHADELDSRRMGHLTGNAGTSAEPPAQPRQHLLGVEPQEPRLVRARRVEHQVPEAHLDIRADLLDMLVRIA